jgi:sulfide:quinone oxidoreductase
MTAADNHSGRFRVVIVGGGITALETVLALQELAGERVAMTVLAPNEEFVYRPMTIREPFAYGAAARYPLRRILADAGAELLAGRLAWVEPERHLLHTEDGVELPYDALVLALGATLYPRYRHAVTIDDRHMDGALHGLIQDLDQGYLTSVAFVVPGRMAWPLPLYELALMTAGRAYDMNVSLQATIVTPEEKPLAVFGEAVSDGVAALLAANDIRVVTSGYVEVPRQGEVVINPGDRRVRAHRVVALPELYGPAVRGLPVSEHGFIRVNRFGRVPDAGPVFAAGDAIDFPIKHGGLGSQQADVVAESIALLAGAEIDAQPFNPVIHGVLLTDGRPRYLAAEITGGHGLASHFSDTPIDGITQKVAARYLTPYLEGLDANAAASDPPDPPQVSSTPRLPTRVP